MDEKTKNRPKGRRDKQLEAVRDALHATWTTPNDTMITGDIPLLLTKLSRVPASDAAKEPTDET